VSRIRDRLIESPKQRQKDTGRRKIIQYTSEWFSGFSCSKSAVQQTTNVSWSCRRASVAVRHGRSPTRIYPTSTSVPGSGEGCSALRLRSTETARPCHPLDAFTTHRHRHSTNNILHDHNESRFRIIPVSIQCSHSVFYLRAKPVLNFVFFDNCILASYWVSWKRLWAYTNEQRKYVCRLLTCNKRTCYTIDKIMKKQTSKEKKNRI